MLYHKTKQFLNKYIFLLLHAIAADRRQWACSSNVPQIIFAHRVVDISLLGKEGEFFQGISAQVLDVIEFIRRLKRLKQSFTFISMDEAIGNDKGLVNNKQRTVLTFDDVYLDFALVIQPILQKMEIPALFFITTQGLEQKELLWYDKVYSAICGTDASKVTLNYLDNCELIFNDLKKKRDAAIKLCGLLWLFDIRKRDEVINELIEKIGCGPLNPETLYLSTEKFKELSLKPNITIGCHTVTHPNLMILQDDEIVKELCESKAKIESIVGYPVKHLSYPNGMADERVWRIAQQCGFDSACMTGKGDPGNRYGLRRINVGWGSFAEFSVRMSGLIPW